MVSGRKSPNMPMARAAPTQFISEKFRLAKSESGIKGSVWNISQTMNRTQTATPAAMISGIVRAPQNAPHS